MLGQERVGTVPPRVWSLAMGWAEYTDAIAMCRLSGQPAQAAERSEVLEGGWLDPDLNQAIEQGTDIAIIFPDAQPANTTG